MKTYSKVKLNTIDKVKEFANIVGSFEGDAFIQQKKYVVDAKSILGLFSLNLLDEMILEFDGEGQQEVLSELMKRGFCS